MKKFFMIAVMAVAAISASAQEVGSFFVTPKVGVNLASMSEFTDSKMRVGLVAGAELGYQTSEANTVSVGLFYSQQGVKVGDNVTHKNDYLNIPVMTSYMLFPGFSIEAGLQPSFLVSAKGKDDTGESDLKDLYNKFDLSLPIGISYEFSKVVLEARYNIGLLKCYKDIEGPNGTMESKTKNNVISFTIGYKL